MDDIPSVEDIVSINIFIYDIDLIDGAMVGELARRSIKTYEKNVQLIRYNSHICYVDKINELFKAFRCPTCDKYFQKTGNLERHLVSCSERVKHIYPKNVYQLRETHFDKLDSFNIQYTDDQKLFTNLAVFDFESICIPEEKFKNTETTTWIGKHVPISVSISSNLIAKPIFLCNSNPRDLVESFIDAVEGLATQSKAQMKLKFLQIETAIKSRLTRTLESLNERRCRNQRVFEFEDQCFEDDDEEKDVSTQFLQMQKNQLIELQEHLERYCNVLPVFGFISAKYEINLIKSFLLPILINERNMEPTVIKNANQFVSFKFGDVQLLDIMNFLGGATSLDSFLKAYKTAETKGFFPYEWFDCPQKMNNSELPFPPIFKNTNVGRYDIGLLMKDYAEKEGLLSQPRKMLISSYFLENGTLITPLLLFYLDLGLVCKTIYRFVKYTPVKCFNKFVQSSVDARREGDENPNSSVVAETMKLLANSSYGYQIMDRSRHTVTKYLTDEKTHGAINTKFFKRLDHINDQLYEVELAKAEIEHREPIIVGFFILQYAKLRMLELYYNFFDRFCDVNKLEELEMDTDSLYLALSEKELCDCIREEAKAEWGLLRTEDCKDDFTANATTNFFPRTCCTKHIKHDKREPGLFKEEFRCTEMLCLCSKTYCCYDSNSNKYKISSKGLNKRTLEECDDGPMAKYRKVLDEFINVTSTNRGFRTVHHSVGTYEQTKKGLSYFYRKRIVDTDGIRTRPLNL